MGIRFKWHFHHHCKIPRNQRWNLQKFSKKIFLTLLGELCDIVAGGCPVRGPSIGEATTPPYQIPTHAPIATYACDTKVRNSDGKMMLCFTWGLQISN
jgi:hypothetical protein